jgi:transcriptional regulator with XRE-family HTH domain
MRWIPKGKEIRRLRASVGWRQIDLARRAKLSPRQLGAIEGKNPPKEILAETVTNLAAALTAGLRQERRYAAGEEQPVVAREDIATWDDGSTAAAPPALPARTKGTKRGPAPSPAEGEEASAEGGPRPREIVRCAEIEQALGLDSETVTTPSGTYPLLGFTNSMLLDPLYKKSQGHPFVVSGKITIFKRMTTKEADALGAKENHGLGISRFCVQRQVRGIIKGKLQTEVFYATVFAPQIDQACHLLECFKRKVAVSVLVRVAVREYDESIGWNGFYIFEDDHHRWPWAFVVDEIVSPALPSLPT